MDRRIRKGGGMSPFDDGAKIVIKVDDSHS